MLVEGVSDQRALATLAERRGRDLNAERVSVVPIGGAISDKQVTYDLARLMEDAHEVSCSGFGRAMIEQM